MNIIVLTLLAFYFELGYEITTDSNSKTIQIDNCKEYEQGNCKRCDQTYFLFPLPQDHRELELIAGTIICVECPYQKFNEANNYYCGDCLDNSQLWDKSRLCTYDYKTKSTGSLSVFHKIERPTKQLFYVIKSGLKDFITQSCDGCEHFCKSQNSTCFPVQKQYSYDLNNMYINCAEGYEYSDEAGGCDPCPDNCKSCSEKNKIKNCLICNKGFSILTLREAENGIDTKSQCIACFMGCDTCYFGNDTINLNEKSWDNFNNKPDLIYNEFKANETKFYEDLFRLQKIAQRCDQCTSTAQSTFIPSLNRRTCVRCGTNCKRCEYTSEIDYPTRNKKIIEPESSEPKTADIDAVESKYLLRCRECDKFYQTFQAVGTGCADCSIQYCKLCAKFDTSSGNDISTISPNFKPLLDENKSVEKCIICEDDYFLSEDQLKCSQPSDDKDKNIIIGCLTYSKLASTKKCLQCNIGYTLYKNAQDIWECTMNCAALMQDYLCQSCVINENVKRCQRCLDGFYVDMKSGKCQKCSENGYCKKCYTFSLVSVHHPEYFDYKFDGESNENSQQNVFGPYCIECNPGDAQKGPILNEDLRYCEKGGENCSLFKAIGSKGYCDQCTANVDISRSSSSDGYDCIQCPEDTIGCRERSEQEKALINKFYNPTDEEYKIYSRLSFKCDGNSQFNSNIGRCISKYDLSASITIKADCGQTASQNNILKINSLFNDITSKNATLILEDYQDNTKALFKEWNQFGINKITIILEFQYSEDIIINNECSFKKDTYFTSNIIKNVFSVQKLELEIVTNSQNNEKIKWLIQKNIYFSYFTSVSLNGIELYSGSDTPFGFQFLNNTGSKLKLENVKIGNKNAEEHYIKTSYTTPYSKEQIINNKQPFFTQLLNTYEIHLKNVNFSSQNYLLSQEISFQAKPFGLFYDSNVILPYLQIKLENVKFQDIAIESQAIFEIQSVNFLTSPEWNNKILLQGVEFENCYFINDGAFLSTKSFNQPMGIININSLTMRNIEYNNSRGIIDFSTMQQIKVNNFKMYDSKVNSTALFYVTTIELSNIYLYNTSFTFKGRLMQTKYELKTIRLNDSEFSGLKLQFINLEFDKVICLTPACLILITEIQNDYDIPINITMKGLIIKQINTTNFDETILEAATSASIRVEKSNTLIVSNFESIENADLTIFYVEQVWTTKFINLNCYQQGGLKIRNNYCLFINNPYKTVELLNTQLLNLIGIDNSFVGISSWSNLIYNTSTADYLETIIINGVYVAQCTINTTVLAVPSSAILIDSTQMQIVKTSFMMFLNNHHFMEIDGSLRPSNPTFLMRSLVGKLILSDSIWRSNSVQGFGAVLYLEVGIQIISNVSMINSNFDSQTKPQIINEITEGGHLYLSAFNLSMSDCTFTNSTSKLGGALFLRTLKEGIIILRNIQIQNAYTPLNGAVSSRGGCLYIDSMASKLDMMIMSSEFNGCITRGEGGGIFLMSYDSIQQFKIEDSELLNCYALSGLAIKTLFYSRTQNMQKMILQQVKISGNEQNFLNYLVQLGFLQQIEKFLFLKRIAAIEQDYGEIEVFNCQSENLFYYGYLSIWQANFIKLNNIQSQNSRLSFRPQIEILEPQKNPLQIDSVQFRNISSITILNLNCSNITSNGLCIILDVRCEFSDFKINPALMLFDLIQRNTILRLENIAINKVICKECHGGLVQIMRVSNRENISLVEIISGRCTNSESSYYGCFTVSIEQQFKQQVEMDNLIGTTINSNLTGEKIKTLTNLNQNYRRILQSETINQTENNLDYNFTTPNSPYFSHITVKNLNIFDVKAVHGGGITIYGLTCNATQIYCSLLQATGRGGCIYFESQPKEGGKIKQRLNIADSNFYRNNASIGGAIAVVESGINNFELTGITFIQNSARLYGNDVAQYPTQMGIKVKNQQQKQFNIDSHTGWLHQPILIKSGYQISEFENQTVVVVFLDKNNRIMGYQYNQTCSLSTIFGNTKGNLSQPLSGNTNRDFIVNDTGFNYSTQIINYDPYSDTTLDAVFNSSHINIPIYHDQYPYQCMGFDTRYTLMVRIRSVECLIGEIYDSTYGICISCYDGTYSLIYKSSLCKIINYETMNYTEKNRIKVQQYHWRPTYESDIIEKCINKKENCNEGFDVGNDLCQIGLIGALCEECDIYATHWGESYYNSAKYECKPCREKSDISQIILIISICAIIIISTLISVSSHEDRIRKLQLIKILRLLEHYCGQRLNETAALIKIFLNFFQVISIFGQLNSVISNNLLSLITLITMPAQSLGSALDCLLVGQEGLLDIIYLRLILSLFLQLGCIILIIIVLFVLVYKHRLTRINLGTMFIYMLIYLQPSFFIEFTNLVLKREISEDLYIQANVSYKYNTYNHQILLKWLAYPGVVILSVLPFILLIRLLLGKFYGRLHIIKFQRIWGYFYHEYFLNDNKRIFYWEFVRIYIRTLICLLFCFFAQQIIYMVTISCILIFFYFLLANYFLPYYNKKLKRLDRLSSVILIIFFFIQTIIYQDSLSENFEISFFQWGIIYLLLLVFLISFIKNIVDLNNLHLDKLRKYLREKYPGLINMIICGSCNMLQIILKNQTEARDRSQKLWKIVKAAVREGIQEWNYDRGRQFKIKDWSSTFMAPLSEGYNIEGNNIQ